MPGLAFFALVGGVIAALSFVEQRRRRARVARARTLATQYGFQIDVGPKPPPGQRFDLFSIGRSKQVRLQLWRPGEADSVFEYRYTTGSGKNSRTYRHTCALVTLPFVAPHTKIGPEGFWSGIGRAVGIRDIEIESPEFNDRYRVTGDDERFAIALLDHGMIAWLLSDASGGGAVKFELWGSWLLCVSDRLTVEQMFGYVDWAQAVRRHMPTVLQSLYPGGSGR